MSAVKTIDVKGLGDARRHEMIFPGIEGLKVGETARLIVEFDPVPLVYLLKAKGGFEVEYEKRGPDEWILRIDRVGQPEDKRQIKEIVNELHEKRPELFEAEK